MIFLFSNNNFFEKKLMAFKKKKLEYIYIEKQKLNVYS